MCVVTFDEAFHARGAARDEAINQIVQGGDAITFLAEGLRAYRRHGNADRIALLQTVLMEMDRDLLETLSIIGSASE